MITEFVVMFFKIANNRKNHWKFGENDKTKAAAGQYSR